MDKEELIDRALSQMMEDIDGIEGNSAGAHSIDECPDPLMCDMHGNEGGAPLMKEDESGSPAAVEITVHKDGIGLPTMEGAKAEDGLEPDDVEALRKILAK